MMKMTLKTGLAILTAFCAASAVFAQQPPAYVAGKVVAVSHEKVTVNTAVLDKITVTVDSCDARGTLKTVHYAPATVSDRTALGHLFQHDYHHAATPNMEKQNMGNGYGIFWTDANGRVLRTGLLGSQTDCSHVSRLVQQFK